MMLEGDFGEVPEYLKEIIRKVFESSHRLALMVDDFLNISRIELGTMKYDMTKFDLAQMARGITNDFMTAAFEKKLDLQTKIEIDPCPITADENKIRQVVANIVDNSIKYTPAGFIKICLSKSFIDKTALITVEDSGMGVSEDMMKRLFQKFSRADQSPRMHTDGSGLGLYIAKRIVEDHKGRIWAESKGEGRGAKFFVELPAS
jgi:signal transduction histidine kinase